MGSISFESDLLNLKNNSNKIILLTGLTGSGKNFILNKISSIVKFETIIQTTTRPIRNNENHGIDYFFITNDEFNFMKKNHRIICDRKFIAKENGKDTLWQYGIEVSNIEDSISYIIAGDMRLANQLKEKYKDRVFNIFIDANQDIRESRIQQRGDFNDAEWERRENDDLFLIEEAYREADMIINNNHKFNNNTLLKICQKLKEND